MEKRRNLEQRRLRRDRGSGSGERDRLRGLLATLDAVYNLALQEQHERQSEIDAADPHFRPSAQNLAHYLALRNVDVRAAQIELARMGLSSLGRSEAHALTTLNAVRARVYAITGNALPASASDEGAVSFESSKSLLEDHTRALLGPDPEDRRVRIMVTLGSEAADDYALVRRLVDSGMDIARVNCAHDDDAVWERMIANVRRAASDVGRECKVLMDLAGRKGRTDGLPSDVQVLHVRPDRNVEGHITAPARVWLAPAGTSPPGGDSRGFSIPVTASMRAMKQGDRVKFTDARGKQRALTVTKREGNGVWASIEQSAYFKTGMLLDVEVLTRKGKRKRAGTLRVGNLEPKAHFIRLERGDTLIVLKGAAQGAAAVRMASGNVREPARISCTRPEVVQALRVGERVLFDDGRIEGIVREVSDQGVAVEITVVAARRARLGNGKGINTPDTDLPLGGLAAEDLQNLDFAAEHADLVGVSFVNSPADVAAAQRELSRRKRPGNAAPIGLVLKIETRRSFEELPQILLQLMQSYPAGVMIARGDLAVELGWERMAEVQEEILWLCEAAHVPTVWATQVLESLAKRGLPSRAEITDAAMAQRAECVMLNKGPHVLDAVSVLGDILKRMQAHQAKKTALLRSLSVSLPPGPKRD